MSPLVYVALVMPAYTMLYLHASIISAVACQTVPNFFNVALVLKECCGVLSRKRRGYRSFCWNMPAFEVLKLDPETATVTDVAEALFRIHSSMDKFPWVYPYSQRRAVEHLATTALVRIRMRDVGRAEIERARRRQEQADRARRQQQERARAQGTNASGTPMNWRQVLGVSPSEQDKAAIKRAYRNKARVAHPDRGGTDAAMVQLNLALSQARAELGFV